MKRARAFLALGALVFAVVPTSCSDWPPGDKGDGEGGSSSSSSDGTCSGTPPPCTLLNTAQCSAVVGCVDNGSCNGNGITCGTARSAALCNAEQGCFWSTVCTGSALGCSAERDQSSCQGTPGCTWVPNDTENGSGGAGSGASCNTYNSPCTTAAQCDCAFSCIQLCASCTSVCARQCRTDNDCTDAVGAGQKTPACIKVNNGAIGACVPR